MAVINSPKKKLANRTCNDHKRTKTLSAILVNKVLNFWHFENKNLKCLKGFDQCTEVGFTIFSVRWIH